MAFIKRYKPVLILLTVLVILTSLLIIYLEQAYKYCHKKLATDFVKNVKSISCYELKEAVITPNSFAKRFSPYLNVYEIERVKIGGNNGLTCVDTAFIAADLPSYAKEYVAYHEYIHTQSNNSETMTNIIAGIKKPIGFAQTVLYSLVQTFTKNGFNNCSLAGIWKIFKVYFLNDSFNDLITL